MIVEDQETLGWVAASVVVDALRAIEVTLDVLRRGGSALLLLDLGFVLEPGLARLVAERDG